jgi:hypothetical protein
MDPYLEEKAVWPEFHRRLVEALSLLLQPNLSAAYFAVVGVRRYADGGENHEEDYLEIRRRGGGELVTLLDIVSPASKTTDAGRRAYLEQRRQARDAGANVAEIDLVLQGQPTLEFSREGLPEWDYAVTVTRAVQPERYEIYTATLQKRLPRFRLPLAVGEGDRVLDLQAAFTRCYGEGGYLGLIHYGPDPVVPLDEEDRRWIDATLTSQGLRGSPPSHEDVAVLAYYLWQQEGCPHGRDKEHWHEALAQLRRPKRASPRLNPPGAGPKP